MDNFDLKKYLVENKVTTNSKMINEEVENSWTMISGVYGGANSEQLMNLKHRPFNGSAEQMAQVATKHRADSEVVTSADLVAFEGEEGEFVLFVKDNLITGPIDQELVDNLYLNMWDM